MIVADVVGRHRDGTLTTVIDQGAYEHDHGDRPDDQGDHCMTTVIDQGDLPDADDVWLTLGAAAEALGLSVVSVRRRIRAGQLVARQVKTDRGPAWRVRLDPGDHPDRHDDHRDRPATTVIDHPDHPGDHGDRRDVTALVTVLREREARIDALTADLVARTEAATMWQGRAETLAYQLADARETIKALQAPPDPDPAPAPDPFPTPIPPAPNVAPWWRRW